MVIRGEDEGYFWFDDPTPNGPPDKEFFDLARGLSHLTAWELQIALDDLAEQLGVAAPSAEHFLATGELDPYPGDPADAVKWALPAPRSRADAPEG